MSWLISLNTKTIFWIIFSFCLAAASPGQNEPVVRWGHQLLTPTQDSIHNGVMVADSNDCIYIVVSRAPKDTPESDSKDQYLLKFNQNGEHLWRRRLGENRKENPLNLVINGLVVDDKDNICAFGYTDGKFGREKIGGYDAFVAGYDKSGTQQWVWQLGTAQHDVCTGMDIDTSGNIYIAGYTYGSFAGPNKGQADIFVAAYDRTGALLWQDQFGTNVDDRAMDLSLGNDNDLYICGSTNGRLSGRGNGYADFVAARYQLTGNRLWLHQYGTPAQDNGICLEVSEKGHLYVGGITFGNFASDRAQLGRGDAFVARISETGQLLWKRQFGSSYWDQTWDLAHFRDGSGDILAGGCQIPSQICQGFCRRYSPEGKLIWIKEFREKSPAGGTCGRTVTVDSANNCYHAGWTRADLFGFNNGTGNVYIVRLEGVLEKPSQNSNPAQ